jgi:hypothetical protein
MFNFVHECKNTQSPISVSWRHQSQHETCCVTSWRPSQLYHKKNPYSQTHTKNHTEATEGSPMHGGTLGFSICLPLHFDEHTLALVNHT